MRSPQEQRKRLECLVLYAVEIARPCPLSKKLLYRMVETDIESPDEIYHVVASLQLAGVIEANDYCLWPKGERDSWAGRAA
jgi:hypothetical protein